MFFTDDSWPLEQSLPMWLYTGTNYTYCYHKPLTVKVGEDRKGLGYILDRENLQPLWQAVATEWVPKWVLVSFYSHLEQILSHELPPVNPPKPHVQLWT